MRISLKLDYANRAVLQLAKSYDEKSILKLEDISTKECIPASFLVQILSDLKKAGIVQSKRGKAGGYALACPPGTISLARVIHAIEPQLLETPSDFEGESAGMLTQAWTSLSSHFQHKAQQITFEELLNEEREPMWFI